jgi:surface protein
MVRVTGRVSPSMAWCSQFAFSHFNGDVSRWDVSAVTNMRAMVRRSFLRVTPHMHAYGGAALLCDDAIDDTSRATPLVPSATCRAAPLV